MRKLFMYCSLWNSSQEWIQKPNCRGRGAYLRVPKWQVGESIEGGCPSWKKNNCRKMVASGVSLECVLNNCYLMIIKTLFYFWRWGGSMYPRSPGWIRHWRFPAILRTVSRRSLSIMSWRASFIALQSRKDFEPVFLQASHPVNRSFCPETLCATYTLVNSSRYNVFLDWWRGF
jgi:hypothetical protein